MKNNHTDSDLIRVDFMNYLHSVMINFDEPACIAKLKKVAAYIRRSEVKAGRTHEKSGVTLNLRRTRTT